MNQRNQNPLEDHEQRAVRLGKRERLAERQGTAYPIGLRPSHSISEINHANDQRDVPLQPDERSGETVTVAGRVISVRNGGKLCFAVIQAGDGQHLQLMLSLAELGEEEMLAWKELIDLGDHIMVAGEVMASRTSQLSVLVNSWQVTSKAVLPLPNLHSDLSDETRVRQRYLDLIVRDAARETVITRAKTLASVRNTLTQDGFLEVETPMLQTLHGGAAARPFVTHSNAFDMDLYLRIAPELFLKRAVVGGLDCVFEINRNFRNEGSDSTHSPEFAMLEAYKAYADYQDMAVIVRTIVQNAVQAVYGSQVAVWADGSEHDFSGEWTFISMYESLSDALGLIITPETSVEQLKALADAVKITVKVPTHGKYVEELWEHYVKDSLNGPTFVMDFPVDTSPLVGDHRSKAGVVEKWDLYVNGFELATGYSELVDPVVQRERLIAQAQLSGAGDVEAMNLDEDFLTALEHGMPPTGGIGMGVDRLLMALTGLGIRETILFPLVK